MRCDGCDGFIDTDEGTGLFENAKPYRFWCDDCVMTAFDHMAANCPIVAAVKVQNPDAYAELTEA
jgi:hypothetical protein